MNKTILAVSLLLPGTVMAGDWSKADTEKEMLYLAFHIADWGQTRNIKHSNGEYEELNPILGKNPSIRRIDSYFVFTGIAHPIVSYLLKDCTILQYSCKNLFQYSTITMEAYVVYRNNSIGLQIDF